MIVHHVSKVSSEDKVFVFIYLFLFYFWAMIKQLLHFHWQPTCFSLDDVWTFIRRLLNAILFAGKKESVFTTMDE